MIDILLSASDVRCVFCTFRISGMPRKYTPKRAYRSTYSNESMEKAVRQVKEGKSVPKAARDNHVPRETLRDTVGGLHKKRCGGQLYLTDELETALVSVLDQLSTWKYPLTSYELRCLVRNYITSCNIESKFKDNMPGYDWAKGFIQRHKRRVATFRRHLSKEVWKWK